MKDPVTILLPFEGGATFTTVSGRTTTPSPPIPGLRSPTTSRKITNAYKRQDAWLQENAVAEAEARGRTDLAQVWRAEEVTKHRFTDVTHHEMFAYLFEWDELVQHDAHHAATRPRRVA